MIELVTGDPWKQDSEGNYTQPASYSRFLLPFSWEPAKISFAQSGSASCDWFFKSCSANTFDKERIFYFTAETANVLFQRALWAKVDAEQWKKAGNNGPFLFHSGKQKRDVEICIAPPQIVLFEWQRGKRPVPHALRHGFLIIETYFPEVAVGSVTPSLDDLLEFNELFRYVAQPYRQHRVEFSDALSEFPADYSSNLRIGDNGNTSPGLQYTHRWQSLLRHPLQTEGCFFSLVPEDKILCDEEQVCASHLACTPNNCLHYSDNRAFVWTAAIISNGASTLAGKYGEDTSKPWNFGHWLKLVNVDQPGKTPFLSHKAISGFEKKWLEKQTYQRWAEWGTWYGYSYHSGAMLAPPIKDNPPLWRHFGEMYFDQILLLFYLRIALFSFSRELTRINQKDDFSKLGNDFYGLRESFAKFTNLYQFPLISNQQQGVEMYVVARKSMDVDDLFKEVQEEISSTHEFIEMRASRRMANSSCVLAFAGVIIAFVAVPQGIAYIWNQPWFHSALKWIHEAVIFID